MIFIEEVFCREILVSELDVVFIMKVLIYKMIFFVIVFSFLVNNGVFGFRMFIESKNMMNFFNEMMLIYKMYREVILGKVVWLSFVIELMFLEMLCVFYVLMEKLMYLFFYF